MQLSYFMLNVLRAVARYVKSAVASGMLAELMRPKADVGTALADPVLVHVGEQIILAEGRDERADVGSIVRRNNRSVLQAICSVRTGRWIVLPVEVAVLGERAVAEVWPQTVNRPPGWREELAFSFQASVCIPELRGEDQATESFCAA